MKIVSTYDALYKQIAPRTWSYFGIFEKNLKYRRIFIIYNHDDVIKWKPFPRYWPFVRRFHWSPVNSTHKGQWRGALMFSLICVLINGSVNNRVPGDLRRYRAHYDVIVMKKSTPKIWKPSITRGPWKFQGIIFDLANVCRDSFTIHDHNNCTQCCLYGWHGPFTRYAKLRVVHAPGMPGTFSPPPRVSDPDMHHGTCVTPVPRCMPGSLTCGFLWSRWRGNRSRHSRRMHNLQFYVFDKSPCITAFCLFVFHIGSKNYFCMDQYWH